MSNTLLRKSSVVTSQLRTDIPEFKTGTEIEVHYKIKEGEKERIQIFKGLVIAMNGGNTIDASFTVLKNATAAVKVERVFPLHSPIIDKVVVVGKVSRGKKSKLYHLRDIKDPIKSVKRTVVKTK